MKTRHFLFTLLTLFVSFTASAYEWTDANGTIWSFTPSGNDAYLYKGDNRPCISGTIPKELTIPSTVYVGETAYSVKTIGNFAFYFCSGLTSITIPNSVTSIDYWAFQSCSSLTSITIPNSVTSIGQNAFSDCSGLTSITIPNGVTSIGYGAFSGCSVLSSITIPKSVTSIGQYVFQSCSGLTSITVESGNPYYDSRNGCNAIIEKATNQLIIGCNSTIIPSDVTSIGDNAFSGCKGLTAITIPNSVKSIGNNAFNSCSGLTSITIGNGVTSIGDFAFDCCLGLTSITIPNSVTYIGKEAFGMGDTNMIVYFESTTPASFSGSNGVFAVPSEAVDAYRQAWSSYASRIVDASYAYKTVDVTAKESSSAVIEEIGEAHASDVVSLKVKGTFNSYDLMVFRNKMINLLHLDLSEANVLGNSYKYYQDYYSKDNIVTSYFVPTRIVSLKLPKDITALEDSAFEGCRNLRTMELPEGITSIPDNAFLWCESLTSVNIPASVTSIGSGAFSFCSALKNIQLPPGLKSIEIGAFSYCNSLTELRLPPYLESIGWQAFSYCNSLTELRLPPYLKSIGDGAFLDCSNLKTIYAYMPNIITVPNGSFPNYTTAQLLIPEFLYWDYYYDTGWSQFTNLNKTTLSPDDYLSFYSNSDNTMGEDDQRIPDTSDGEHIDAEIDTQGSFTVEGNEPQPFDEVNQIIDPDNGQGGSLIGTDDGQTTGNLDINSLRVNIRVKPGRWYFFIFPYDVTIANVEYPGQYAWLEYDGAQRATGQTGWKTVEGETLQALHGYAFQTGKQGTMVVTFNAPKFGGDRIVELLAHAAENIQHASWNLVGNFTSSFHELLEDAFSSPIIRWNPSNNTYEAYRPGEDDCHLQPYEAFFVQKPGNMDHIKFKDVCRESYRQSQEKAANNAVKRRAKGIDPQRRLINLQLLNGEQEADRTRVVLNNGAQHAYEMECDAPKFMSDLATAQLYSVEGGIEMSINERPFEGDIRLGYTAAKAGRLSITAPRMDLPMMLVDSKLGVTFDLSVGSYDFDTEAGTFNGRFQLRMGKDATAINNLAEKTGVCLGTQDGGLSVGGAEGKSVSIYNIGGAEVASQTGNGFVALKSGIYVVKVDGESVKISVK